MPTKQEEIAELREELKNGRVDKASTAIDTDDRDYDGTDGASFQTARREVTTLAQLRRDTSNGNGSTRHDRPGIEKEPIGVRPGDRRSSENHGGVASSTTSTSTTTGTVGRLEPDGPIPGRIIDDDISVNKQSSTFQSNQSTLTDEQSQLSSKYPNLKSIFDVQPNISLDSLAGLLNVSHGTAHSVKKQWFSSTEKAEPIKEPFRLPGLPGISGGKGKTLTEKEASELTDSFPAALLSNFDVLDQYLWFRQSGVGIEHHKEPVWSDVDDEELAALTRIMLRMGKRNATAAVVVRAVVDSSDYIAVGTVFVPRVVQTVKIMKQTRQPRKGRGNIDTANK